MYQKSHASDEGADLIGATAQLLAEGGVHAATTRAVAARAGASSSLIRYRFGSVDRLIHATLEECLREHVTVWDERAALWRSCGYFEESAPVTVHALAREAATYRRDLFAHLWIALFRPDVSADFKLAWLDPFDQFWREVPLTAGTTGYERRLLTLFLANVARGFLIAPSDADFDPWFRVVCDRLVDRLSGRAPAGLGDSPWRLAIETTAGDPSEIEARGGTPWRIVSACAELLLADSDSRITHRLIAEKAGVSLSSMTHHFASLENIIVAACRSLYWSLGQEHFYKKVASNLPEPNVRDMLWSLPEQMRPGGNIIRSQLHMVARVTHLVSQFDAARPTALALHVQPGVRSSRMLENTAGLPPTDRIDGYMLSVLQTSAYLLADIEADADASRQIAEAVQGLVLRLFPIPDFS